jgi:23S rRNA (guanosine2251-2'-O)-methyltransferase
MTQTDTNNYIYGRNPIEEALRSEAERVEKIFVRKSVRDSQLTTLFNLASQHHIPISHVPGSKLYELVGDVNDQGVVAMMGEVSYQDFGTWLDTIDTSTYPAVLLMDEIKDSGNLGAMLRTAVATGISAVLVPKHRQAPINSTVYKTSAGTAGRIPIVRAGNLNRAIEKLKDEGFWIAGLDMDGDQELWELEVDRPLAFVVGSEEDGISPKTLEHCDYKFRIPMENKVESLNVSVSTALLCYEWKRKK